MISVNDIDFLPAFRDGDHDAFNAVFKEYHAPVRHFALSFTKDSFYANDIASFSFMKLFERCMCFHSIAGIKAFLFVVTRNGCYSYLRSTQKENAELESFKEYMSGAIEKIDYANDDLMQQVSKIVAEMPAKRKQVIMLVADGHSTKYIAKQLNMHVDTVRSLKRHAIKQIRSGF